MRRLLYIVTHPMTARYLLAGQLNWMRNKGFEVFLCASPGTDLQLTSEREGVAVFPVSMEREIHPVKDFLSLIRLYFLIRRIKPDIVNAGTPKAGLLGMIASWLARIPVRIYTLRGLRLETKKGFGRGLLSLTERTASGCATGVLAVSESLKQRYLSLRLVKESKIRVLGHGSSNGVDLVRFSQEQSTEEKNKRKEALGIPQNALVVGYVGRLVRDKGIRELLQAFDTLKLEFPRLHLLILGDFEKGDPVDPELASKIRSTAEIVAPGFVPDVSSFYALMDVLAFPSYREGFPNTPLEAACAGVPTVGFRVTGTSDAVEENVTGLLVEPGNAGSFAAAIGKYLRDPDLRRTHGEAARERVNRYYTGEFVWQTLYKEYLELLEPEKNSNRGIPAAMA